MAYTPTAHPRGFWKREADTLRRIAPTMTIEQLMARYGVNRTRMRQELCKLNVEFAGKQKDALNSTQIAQLPELAQTHTPAQIAQHFGIATDLVHHYLSRRNIKAQSGASVSIWKARRAELEQIAPRMSLKQLQAHYANQGHHHTLGAVRQALFLMNIDWLHTKAKSPLYDRLQELQQLATHMTCRQMAVHLGYGPKYLWKFLDKAGIKALHGKSGPAPKPNTKPHPTPARNNPKPLLAATPSRASIASKAPAQIIWPEHVQIQRIPLATPPAHAPICAGTARGTYKPSSDWYRSPRAM